MPIKIINIPKGPLVFVKLIMMLFNLPGYKRILIQYEWSVFGQGVFYLVLFPLFLLGVKLMGKKTFVVLHGVCFDFTPIYGKKLSSYLFNIFSKAFYYLVVLFSYKVIVTEQALKERLQKTIHFKHIEFIPHGVDTRFFLKSKDRKKSEFILGYFGFLHLYKGAHLLLDLYQKAREMGMLSGSKLIFVGGESINQLNDKNYRLFLDLFYKKAEKNSVEVTGFLDEQKLKKYYGACDLVILPNPVFISSSGVLAMAFSFEKPILLSRPLEGYLESRDFAAALKQACLKKENLIFDFTPESLQERLNFVKKNQEKFIQFSRLMKEKRSWKKIARKYLQILT